MRPSDELAALRVVARAIDGVPEWAPTTPTPMTTAAVLTAMLTRRERFTCAPSRFGVERALSSAARGPASGAAPSLSPNHRERFPRGIVQAIGVKTGAGD